MYTDIIRPSGDEQHFFDMAKKLGYSKLILFYPQKLAEKIAPSFSDLSTKASSYNLSITLGTTQNSKIFSANGISPVIIAEPKENSRAVFEQRSTDYVYGLELTG